MILQSCPLCARQYEVSHLAPGDLVRCACDVEFTVERPSDVRVRGLRCTGCGGPAAPDDEACAYCGAELDARHRASVLCPGCFTRVDAGAAHCQGCGAKLEPQALPPIPAGQDCPRCQGKLQIRSLGTASVIECSACHGLWLEPTLFKTVCRDAQREGVAPFAESERPAAERTPSTLGYIPCLDCGELMLRRQFRHRSRPTGVVLDYCRDHGVWFDGKELETIVRAIREGASDAPDVELIEEALRPRLEVRTWPEGARRSAPGGSGGSGGFSLGDLLGALGNLFV